MKMLVFIFFSLAQLSAMDHNDCIAKLEELGTLKADKATWIERSAAFVFTGNWASLSKSEQDRLIEERIRVLTLELKSCKGIQEN